MRGNLLIFRPLETDRLILRNWQERDRDLFYKINSDDTIMRFFPFRRNREQSDQLMDKLAGMQIKNGFGFSPIEVKKTRECIGFCGLHYCSPSLGLSEGSIEIGWRLTPEFWGKGYATEAAMRWLDFGFTQLELTEIVSFAVFNNFASIAVMRRIGMTAEPSADFDHLDVPDTHPHLKRHAFYRITKHSWLQSDSK